MFLSFSLSKINGNILKWGLKIIITTICSIIFKTGYWEHRSLVNFTFLFQYVWKTSLRIFRSPVWQTSFSVHSLFSLLFSPQNFLWCTNTCFWYLSHSVIQLLRRHRYMLVNHHTWDSSLSMAPHKMLHHPPSPDPSNARQRHRLRMQEEPSPYPAASWKKGRGTTNTHWSVHALWVPGAPQGRALKPALLQGPLILWLCKFQRGWCSVPRDTASQTGQGLARHPADKLPASNESWRLWEETR